MSNACSDLMPILSVADHDGSGNMIIQPPTPACKADPVWCAVCLFSAHLRITRQKNSYARCLGLIYILSLQQAMMEERFHSLKPPHLHYVIIRCVVNTYLRVLHVYAGASHINTITILILSFGSGNMNPSNSYLISISSLIGILPNLETRTANKVNRIHALMWVTV